MSQLRKRYLSENASIGSQQTFSLGRKLLLNDRVIDYSSLLPNAFYTQIHTLKSLEEL